jgi:hypothetical protein
MPDLPPPLTVSPALRVLALLRNAIPLAGVFRLGWSPLQYALLFLADACLRAVGGARLPRARPPGRRLRLRRRRARAA